MFSNKDKTLPSLIAMVAFARVVEAGSFTAAARDLGLSTPVVSKRVAALEHELGTRLLHRTTRKLSLTEAGSALYQHCVRLIEEAKMAEMAVARLNEAPRGLLRITAPFSFGSNQIAPAIPEFLERYPEVSIEMVLSDRIIDLAEDGFDLAVRQTDDPQPNLVAKRLTTTRKLVCASPEYWRKHGKPLKPADLESHNCILYGSLPSNSEWVFNSKEREERVRVKGNFIVNGPEALREAAVGGMGVIRLTSISILQEVKAGRLETALDEYAAADTDIYMMYLPNRYLSKKTRVFIDFYMEWYAKRNPKTPCL
ncbi:MAG: LysR family transcriptional regulator [Thiotrichales bacterium]|nr:LysR family transcriptional regulator [Thiotrichales bacterium]